MTKDEWDQLDPAHQRAAVALALDHQLFVYAVTPTTRFLKVELGRGVEELQSYGWLISTALRPANEGRPYLCVVWEALPLLSEHLNALAVVHTLSRE